MVKFLDLKAQYSNIKQEVDYAIQQVISESAFIGGKYVARFESEFAQYTNTDFCIGVGNGTDALEIALESLRLEEGAEVIVPANSFIASSEAVTRNGCKVVFCDCDENNYTLSIKSVKEKITKKTKAIIAVHLYGHPCDMGSLLDIAKENNIYIIEDCAQAHGAEYKGQVVGSIGDVAAFSFYPGKNLGAYGDAGAIVTNNEQIAGKCRMIANHGRTGKYNHEFEGRNSRLDGLQAAILSVKLKYINEWTNARIKVADYYLENLRGVKGLVLPVRESWAKQVYHLFVVRVGKRDNLRQYLNDNNIECGVHYPVALPKLKAYEYVGQYNELMFANQSDVQLLSLPIGEHLSEADLVEVVEAVKNGLADG